MRQGLRGPLAGALALAVALGVLAVLLARGDEQEGGTVDRLPPGFLGIVSEDVFAGDATYRRRNLARQAEAGVRLIRQTFDWARIERNPGRYDFSYYDRYMAALARHRIRVLPILFNPPPFRSSRPARRGRRGTYPPRRPADLGAFGAALARRYGPHGELWRRRPDLPRTPVRAWQIWNEPSLPVYWPSGPDAAAYVRLLSATGHAIKRVDPGAEIVTAGLAESRLGVPFGRFLRGMYEAGGARAFDVLGVHPFARDEGAVLAAVQIAREIAAEKGHHPPIWVTELGWATGGPRSAFRVSERRQAELIERTIAALTRRQRALGLRGVVYFNWKDAPPFPGGRDFFGLHTGLLRRDGSAKPGLAAFSRVARRGG